MYRKIPATYLKDIAAMAHTIEKVDSASEHLWVTGEVQLTDGDVTYTLVYEDDQWWIDPDKTVGGPDEE